MNAITNTYNKHWLADHCYDFTSDLIPIFIVGMPRSGSSLLEQILSIHREVAACGESKFFGHMMYDLCKNRGAKSLVDALKYHHFNGR